MRLFKGRHFDHPVILLCVRWYLAYSLSLRALGIALPIYNDRIEQNHRASKRRIRPLLGFRSMDSARAILGGIEMVHMMRKGQANYALNPQPLLAEQFD